jgi:hypothetical protein
MARLRSAVQGMIAAAAGIAIAAAVAAPGLAGVTAPGASWHTALRIPLPSDAAADPNASLSGIACSVAGSCVAGGSYGNKAGHQLAIVARESDGKWARAFSLRLPPGASADPGADVNAVACPAASYCVAVGFYRQGFFQHGFIATESGGRWSRAIQPSLPAKHSAGQETDLLGVRCTARRACVAVGTYFDRRGRGQAMIVTESAGKWRRAIGVRLPRNAAGDPGAELDDVGCPSGTCVAVGSYQTGHDVNQGMAVVKSKGNWGRATETRLPANAKSKDAFLSHVTCSAPSSCLAVGGYSTRSGRQAAMADTLSKGGWRRAIQVAGPARARSADFFGVSCSAASCLAVGSYLDSSGATRGLSVLESHGKWGSAAEVRPPAGAAAGSRHFTLLLAVACLNGGTCTAAGSYNDGSGHSHAMAAVRG